MILKNMMAWGGRKMFGKIAGSIFAMIARTISKATRTWLVTNVAELEAEALKTETDADDAAVGLIKGMFGIETNGPIDSAISPEFKAVLVDFIDRLEKKTKTTPNDIDDVAAEIIRGLFNIHQEI